MNIRCINCGALIDIDPDIDFFHCPYCGSGLYLAHRGTVQHLLLKPHRAPSMQEVRKRMTSWFKEREIPPKFNLKSFSLLYIPFWIRRKPDGREEIDLATSRIVFTGKNFHVPSGDFIPFDKNAVPPEYEIIVPDIDLESLQEAEGKDIDETSKKERETSSRLIHIPFSEVSYKMYRREYSLLMDINSEQIFADTMPPSASGIISSALTFTTIGLFVLFFALCSLIPNPQSRLILTLLLCVPAYFLVDRILNFWRM